MATIYNTSIVRDGLVLYLDAANIKSYPGTGTVWKDLSGYGNDHNIIGSPTHANGKFNLTDGMGFSRAAALNGIGSTCTVVIAYSTTTSELWARGQQYNAYYLSAAGTGGTYYHSNCGTVTNYVDNALSTSPNRNGLYHISEAKNVDFSAWTYYEWFLYPGEWLLTGSVQTIMVYNRAISSAESTANYIALKGRYNL